MDMNRMIWNHWVWDNSIFRKRPRSWGVSFSVWPVYFKIREKIEFQNTNTYYFSHVKATPTSISTTEDNEVYFGEIRLVRNASAKAVSYPCTCAGGQCSCCSGNVLENFSINMRQRVCMNMTYDADDFTIGMKLALNDNVFYNTKISGR